MRCEREERKRRREMRRGIDDNRDRDVKRERKAGNLQLEADSAASFTSESSCPQTPIKWSQSKWCLRQMNDQRDTDVKR